jgi:hypothetical protein
MKNLNLLTLIFGILKLTETVDWSWWVVLSPTLAGLILNILGGIFTFIVNKLR